jgi:hypothetical protein
MRTPGTRGPDPTRPPRRTTRRAGSEGATARPIKDTLRDVIRTEFRPLAHRTGFRGAGRAWEYRRRMGEVVQSIQFQIATIVRQEAEFSIYVGLSFDGPRATMGMPLPEVDGPGSTGSEFLRNLHHLTAEAPLRWAVSPTTDLDAFRANLRVVLELAIAELDAIDSARAFLRHRWSGGMADRVLAARLYYSLGEYAAALEELRRAERYFLHMNVAETIERYHLAELRPWAALGAD